jgi:hypothetical protein
MFYEDIDIIWAGYRSFNTDTAYQKILVYAVKKLIYK